jgi:hypothetical protein
MPGSASAPPVRRFVPRNLLGASTYVPHRGFVFQTARAHVLPYRVPRGRPKIPRPVSAHVLPCRASRDRPKTPRPACASARLGLPVAPFAALKDQAAAVRPTASSYAALQGGVAAAPRPAPALQGPSAAVTKAAALLGRAALRRAALALYSPEAGGGHPTLRDRSGVCSGSTRGVGHKEAPYASGPGGGHGGQAFGEDAATAVWIVAKPLADAQLQAHALLRPRQIGNGAFIGVACTGPGTPKAPWCYPAKCSVS